MSSGFLTHSTWLLADNVLHRCGYNEDGQLGNGTSGATTDVYAFTKFEIPNETVATIGAGYQHTMVITRTGRMFGFGNNEKGQLGILRNGNPTKANPNPTEVASTVKWAKVSAGSEHTLALSTDGKVFAFGSNAFGQLGVGGNMQAAFSPVQIPFFSNLRVTKILAGYDHSFVWTDNGDIYSFGKNAHSQCGLQLMDDTIPTPKKLGCGFNVTMIAPGNTHTFVLDEKNQVWGIGYMTKDLDWGQVPTLIHSFNEKVVSLQSGGFHCNVFTASGKLYSFGQNGYKQVGVQQTGTIKSFQQILLPVNGQNIQSIMTGYHHSLALTGDGKLIAWGAQSHGQLGTGVKVNLALPSQVNSNQRFSDLYLASSSSGPIEIVEETIVLGGLKKDYEKERLEAEMQSLRIQQQGGISQTQTQQLGSGPLNMNFMK